MTAMPQEVPMERRRAGRELLLGRALTYVGAVLLALFILVPIYLIAVSAFTPRENAFDFPKSVIPTAVSADTILFFLNASGVIDAFWRSVIVALITLGLSLLIGAPYRVADVDDVIINVLGVALGYGLYRAVALLLPADPTVQPAS